MFEVPSAAPPSPSLSQATTKRPSGPAATAGARWIPAVCVLIWNSPVSGVPSAAKRRPWMLLAEVSEPPETSLCQTTR